MPRLPALSLTLAAVLASAAAAQETPPPAGPVERVSVSPDSVRAHVAFLADDLLEGRDAGTRGYDLAARYVATQFEALGLKPGGTDAKGSWTQTITFRAERLNPDKPGALTIGTQRFANGQDVLIAPDARFSDQTLSAPAVFVGHGVVAPAQKIDDYAGLDVKGKIVVMVRAMPPGLPSELSAALSAGRNEEASKRGAVAVLTLMTSDIVRQMPPNALQRELSRPRTRMLEPDGQPLLRAPGLQATAGVTGAAATALFAGAPRSFAQIDEAVQKKTKLKGFALPAPVTIAQSTTSTTMRSANVIGVLPGTDPALSGETVLLTAHLDHNGINPNAPGADKVFNGAMDNAAGVATMLEAARAFVASGKPPRRSVMFVALTAEEDGLLGSDYLARHPAVAAPGRVVADVNLDMPVLLYKLDDVVAFGAEHSTVGEAVARAAAQSGLALSPDFMPEENVFVRSDHYSFVRQGVPSVMLATGVRNGGDAIFRAFLAKTYHTPADQADLPFDWASAARFAEVNYRIARDLADAPQAPRWYADSPFAARFAAGQPKATRPAAAAK